MGKVYAGLDAASSTCHVVAVDPEGSVVFDRKFDTSEANLISVFESIKGEVHVHLEATDLAGWIRRVLKPRVARVLVGHAKSSAWIAKDPLKRDRLDAYKLAELLRMGRVHEVYFDDEDHRARFKQIVQHYDDLTQQQVRLKNKVKARLRAQGVIARGKTVYTPRGRGRWLGQVPSPVTREAILQLYELLDQTLAAQEHAAELMQREAGRYPEIALFDEVPGVGLVGACRFSAYVQTPHRFSSKRKLWRFCRLGIVDRSSDDKPLGRRMLDYNGVGSLKHMSRHAFEGAMRTKKDNLFKRSYRESLHRTHNATHARLNTQRKILSVLRAMWLSGRRYDENVAG